MITVNGEFQNYCIKNFSSIKIIEEEFKVIGIEEELTTKGKAKITNKVYLNGAEKFQWPDINIDVISCNGFCQGLRNQFGILCDGTVIPCCLDSEGNINLGNIYDRELNDILNGDRAKKIYDNFSNRIKVEEIGRAHV